MDYCINPKAVEIIDDYMQKRKPVCFGTERFCMATFNAMCEEVFYEKSGYGLVKLKENIHYMPRNFHLFDESNEFEVKRKTYFDGMSFYQFSFYSGRGYGQKYFLRGKCEIFFQRNARKIIGLFIKERYANIERAIVETECFMELWNEFGNWFEDRRKKFMENMELDIRNTQEVSKNKAPQSHGGVANLLKVLTKTMEKQGADISSIAKVQYAICVQAGIYIPDEFIRDVAVTLDMPISKEREE